MSDAKKTQKNWRGTVLLSEQMEDYLDAGKAEEGGLLQKPRTYILCGTWVSRLSEESIANQMWRKKAKETFLWRWLAFFLTLKADHMTTDYYYTVTAFPT